MKHLRLVIILTLAILLPARNTLYAQSPSNVVTIYSVDDSNFPAVTVNLGVTDSTGRPVIGLTPSAIEIIEDGAPAEVSSVKDVVDTTQGVAVVLVLDISESMTGIAPSSAGRESAATARTLLAAGRESAITFVDGLGQNDQIAVLVFNNLVKEIQPFTLDKSAAKTVLGKIEVSGTVAALYDAANQGALTASRSNLSRRMVILLTNGAEYSGTSLSSADDAYKTARANAVTIHTILYGYNIDTNYVQRLAGLTGGTVLTAPTPTDLKTQWQSLSQLMHQTVQVIFRSNVPSDGRSHTLTVRVKIGGSPIEANSTFRSKLIPPTAAATPTPTVTPPTAATPVIASSSTDNTSLILITSAFIVLAAIIFSVVLVSRRRSPLSPKPSGPRLEVLAGPDKGKVFPITNERQLIGRLSTAPIVLSDPNGVFHVSREHAHVWQEDGKVFIEDAGSRYGTNVNGRKIGEPTQLLNDSLITVGEIEIIFHGAPVAAGDLRETRFEPQAKLSSEEDDEETRHTRVKEASEDEEARETQVKGGDESQDDSENRQTKLKS
jgi:VWFA-related protein